MENNILDDFDAEQEDDILIDEDNLLETIWLHPTATLNYALKYCPEKYLYLFFLLGGITSAIDRASNKGLADTTSTPLILMMATIGGALFGWISYYLYAWAMSFTGRWLDGKGQPAQFRTIIGWALVPLIASLALLPIELIIFGEDWFRSEMENDTPLMFGLFIFFILIELALGIWSVVILVCGIKIVQHFATGKAILNMILPGLVLIGFILGIALLFSLF